MQGGWMCSITARKTTSSYPAFGLSGVRRNGQSKTQDHLMDRKSATKFLLFITIYKDC